MGKEIRAIDEFPKDLFSVMEKCISQPELYNKHFINITRLTCEKLTIINSRKDMNLVAISFMRNYADTNEAFKEIMNAYFKISSCGLYCGNPYIVKNINYAEQSVTIKFISWGPDENFFDIKDEKISFAAFLFSKEDIDINLLFNHEKLE